MRKVFIFRSLAIIISALAIFPIRGQVAMSEDKNVGALADEDRINLDCLRGAYPEIISLEKKTDGALFLRFRNGAEIPYRTRGATEEDAATSMAQIYPPEPARPDPIDGFSPGRARPYPFLEALYGENKGEVQKKLKTVRLPGGKVALTGAAAEALARVAPRLERLYNTRPDLRKFLKVDGGFYWRKIAGENKASAHSYGLAIDLGADVAPYWRWAKKPRHQLQKSYSPEIVEIMEDAGFIWGGKWDKYDLMHFEYRPELICKGRKLYKKDENQN